MSRLFAIIFWEKYAEEKTFVMYHKICLLRGRNVRNLPIEYKMLWGWPGEGREEKGIGGFPFG